MGRLGGQCAIHRVCRLSMGCPSKVVVVVVLLARSCARVPDSCQYIRDSGHGWSLALVIASPHLMPRACRRCWCMYPWMVPSKRRLLQRVRCRGSHLGAFLWCCMISASTAFPRHFRWRLASCHHVAYTTGDFATLRMATGVRAHWLWQLGYHYQWWKSAWLPTGLLRCRS